MDFYKIKERNIKNGGKEIYPDFIIGRSNDLMVRGKSFYAIWDEKKGLWSTDEYDVQRLVDEDLLNSQKSSKTKYDGFIHLRLMKDFSSKSWFNFRNYMANVSDNAQQLDSRITFSNSKTKKEDYISKHLKYPLLKGDIQSFEKIISTLYNPDEREKIEWSIGSVVSGESIDIQKFIVFYGDPGSGKSTILNIIQKLFECYYGVFEAKVLTSSSAFALEAFKSNSLVAIDHDADLSKIEDNTRLNSIVSHEVITMNEKNKPTYKIKSDALLFMGTNKPVKITDAKSGVIRRLIDIRPSGRKLSSDMYRKLTKQIDSELGAIAYHCLQVYRNLSKDYYNSYNPFDMILQTDIFFNFVESCYDVFISEPGIKLQQAYIMYKEYCTDSMLEFKMPKHKFREELKNYFKDFHDIIRVNGIQIRSYYEGFLSAKFDSTNTNPQNVAKDILTMDKTKSILDDIYKDCKAQYATSKEIPSAKWDKVKTKLSDIDTSKIHYIKPPENHIVIDFDLRDQDGNKSMVKNIDAANSWPRTYSELSKSGGGIHLHYVYEGDVTRLSRHHSEGVEIKVFTGDSSLRRKLTKCNDLDIRTINSGLPLKGESMINSDTVKSEKGLRELIKRNLQKDIHPGTKSSIDFIHKILDDSYKSGLSFDVTDLRPAILSFANGSSHQADYCIKLVTKMIFQSDVMELTKDSYAKDELVFFDVEVFPNLFVIVWMKAGGIPVKMINPKAGDIEQLLNMKLIGFNCRRYDNHILYARYIGYTNEQLYTLSRRIINDSVNCMFSEAYNMSYADVYDFASAVNKKGLKKFEIELGIHHQELGFDWNEPVPEDKWMLIADYCANDVVATEAVFNHLAGDWAVRQILSELSGLTVNDTTNSHAAKIVFGDDPRPQDKGVYTDLSIMFPGYTFNNFKSIYRGEETGEGGYVYAEPGMYSNVAVLDIASMHPTSIEELNLFGPYTKRYSQVKHGRLFLKHKDYSGLANVLEGKLKSFIPKIEKGELSPKDLSNGLKTVLNSAYGLTFAKFDNKFKDPRNVDNIVAKRGALFMIDLKHEVQERGYIVAHIKTDSIKIPNATNDILSFVMDFGKKYGYDFEHEETFKKMCLVNDAVYIAKDSNDKWVATGTQFAQPYVYKTLFSKEAIMFKDMCETKSVTTSMYLDMNENLGDEHDYHFVGRVGLFCPIQSGCGGGLLLRKKEDKYNAVTGTKGYRWMESEMVKTLGKEKYIDMKYYKDLVNSAIDNISKFGDFEWFVSNDKVPNFCSKNEVADCLDCDSWINTEHHANLCLLGYDCIPF